MSIMASKTAFTNPQAIAEAGERIYREKYQAKYEKDHLGSFVAIDVMSGRAFVAVTPEEALDNGRKESPNGFFHLIRVGSPGAFRASYSSHASRSGLFR